MPFEYYATYSAEHVQTTIFTIVPYIEGEPKIGAVPVDLGLTNAVHSGETGEIERGTTKGRTSQISCLKPRNLLCKPPDLIAEMSL